MSATPGNTHSACRPEHCATASADARTAAARQKSRPGCEYPVFEIASGRGPVDRCPDGRQAFIDRFDLPPPRRRHLEKMNDLVDRLGVDRRVARRVAVAHQKSAVANDAVAHRAEAGEKDEQPLLEQRRHGIVEIGRLREIPELLDNLRRIPRGHEEIGTSPKRRITSWRNGLSTVPPHTLHSYFLRSCSASPEAGRVTLTSHIGTAQTGQRGW